MAQRTVKVDLTASVDRYEASVNDAYTDTKRLRNEAERFSGKKYSAELDVNTKKAEANVARLKKRIEMDNPQLGLDIREAELNAAQVERTLTKLRNMDASPAVDLKIAQAEAKLGRINAKLEDLHNRKVSPEVHAELAAAEAELAKFQSELNHIDGQTVTAHAKVEVRDGISKVAMLSAALGTLGPAAIGAGAVAVGAIGGLTSTLSIGAAAAGAVGLAFSGMGDAISAANAYALEPTAENLKKLTEAQKGLTQSQKDFASFVSTKVMPAVRQLQATSANGLMPGVQKGLSELMVILPAVDGLLGETARTLGDMAAATGDALNNGLWQKYIGFIQAEARPTLTGLGTAIGKLIEGFAAMQMAFALFTETSLTVCGIWLPSSPIGHRLPTSLTSLRTFSRWVRRSWICLCPSAPLSVDSLRLVRPLPRSCWTSSPRLLTWSPPSPTFRWWVPL